MQLKQRPPLILEEALKLGGPFEDFMCLAFVPPPEAVIGCVSYRAKKNPLVGPICALSASGAPSIWGYAIASRTGPALQRPAQQETG